MDCENIKTKPLSKEETKCLLDIIESSKINTTKTTNATSNKTKNEEWIRITLKFNATAADCPRKPQQLRLKWENLKKNAHKRSTKIRMNQIKCQYLRTLSDTDRGPAEYIPPDDILDRVTSLLGSTVSGFTVPFGVKKSIKQDDSSSARNHAIADYFKAKQLCIGSKVENIKLENENLKLKNEKLLLDIEKLKCELENLRKQC